MLMRPISFSPLLLAAVVMAGFAAPVAGAQEGAKPEKATAESAAGRQEVADSDISSYHDAVRRAVEWIGRQAVPVKGAEAAVTFPSTAENPKDRPSRVYGGTAGVLLFLENAHAVLGDEAIGALADRAAAGLRATVEKNDEGLTWSPGQRDGSSSLYVGDAGIGHAFLVRARLRGSDADLAYATAVGDALLARADRFEGMLCWDDQVEIIYGAAGTALFLLELAEATGEQRFRDTALQAGRWMISESEVIEPKNEESAPRQRKWRWQLGGNADYVGFSHGTAGVAYALLRIGVACKDAACVDAAKDGAVWLRGQSIREERLLRWPVVPNSKMSMGGWCHGAPGSARLLLSLYQHTGEQEYLDDALASARWVMAQAGPEDAKEPPAFPPSFCCGVAGVIDFFCDLHRATDDPEFAAFARRAGGYLLALAQADGEGLKWPNGRNAHQQSEQQHNIDLMLGAAGDAYVLLRLSQLSEKKEAIVPLPDRRVRI